MLNRITKSFQKLNTTQTALYNWIQSKDDFQRSEISEQANLLGIKDRTLSDILNRFIELNLIERVQQGVYAKR
jgi:DNA-binding MarR family transcriptional regulator